MPMEVFTISGPALGTSAYDRTRSEGKTAASAAATSSAPPAVRLQNALAALGQARGDSSLNISIDGAIGPGTVKAVNYALKNIIGAGPAQAAGLTGRFLNATATKADVQNYAATLAQVVTKAVQNAGGTVPPPPSVMARSRGGGGGRSSSLPESAMVADNSMMNPQLVWVGGGIALIVVALGFMAARRKAAAA